MAAAETLLKPYFNLNHFSLGGISYHKDLILHRFHTQRIMRFSVLRPSIVIPIKHANPRLCEISATLTTADMALVITHMNRQSNIQRRLRLLQLFDSLSVQYRSESLTPNQPKLARLNPGGAAATFSRS
jgi:hypothetical protein